MDNVLAVQFAQRLQEIDGIAHRIILGNGIISLQDGRKRRSLHVFHDNEDIVALGYIVVYGREAGGLGDGHDIGFLVVQLGISPGPLHIFNDVPAGKALMVARKDQAAAAASQLPNVVIVVFKDFFDLFFDYRRLVFHLNM